MPERANPDEILTATGAARVLGLTSDFVRMLARQGRLPSARAANGHHRFRRGDVERLAQDRTGRLTQETER